MGKLGENVETVQKGHNCPKHGRERCFLFCRLGSSADLHFCTLTLAWRGDLEKIGEIES
jgi:hypothetical protein